MRPTYWRAMTRGRLLWWWWRGLNWPSRLLLWLGRMLEPHATRAATDPDARAYNTIRSLRATGHTVSARDWDRYTNGGGSE